MYTYIYIYVYIYVCICIYIYIYVFIYGCILFIYEYLLVLHKALSQLRNPIPHPLEILGVDWKVDAARSSG
jgi:hypothetical protein